ncbi:hypothetical protein Y032_0029g1971 [Ancylostoma ceylanicum]|uniref:Uncharacterized protein n=1 Tax=Ancylostoma ceylanicum TaxID=53326 RepID=A0A016URA8_9BILA|nr:hypothetical protein Y032_0029g1971 [Ancylostoma ceylanicum]
MNAVPATTMPQRSRISTMKHSRSHEHKITTLWFAYQRRQCYATMLDEVDTHHLPSSRIVFQNATMKANFSTKISGRRNSMSCARKLPEEPKWVLAISHSFQYLRIIRRFRRVNEPKKIKM